MFVAAKRTLGGLRDYLKLLISSEETTDPRNRPRFELPTPPVFSLQEKILRDNWLHYLTWEEKNPLELKSEDYVARTLGVYRQAVVPMRFYGEVW